MRARGSEQLPCLPSSLVKRHAVVLVSVAALVLLLCLFPRTHLLSLEKAQRGEPPKLDFVIKLLTYDRLHSLIRCLHSLAKADYDAYTVKLHVFIDHFELGDGSTAVVSSKLKEAHDIVRFVDTFTWIHGPKEIHYRTHNAGLQGQWLEAWWPASDNEFAFMVEDDMQLSPLYFKYLMQVIHTYYYDPTNYDPYIYGISLQRPRFVPGKHGSPLRLENATHLFLYQLVGTWGQLLFPRPWKEFRLWYDAHKSMNIEPLLDGMVTSGWYHRSRGRIWTPWFIKFAHSKGYFNFYTHFPNEHALSVSHRDKGVNTKKGAGPDSKLIGIGDMLGTSLWPMGPLKQLKRYDFCFHEVPQGRLMKSPQDLYRLLPSFQANGTVILVNTLGLSEEVIRNWLCQFSKFRRTNYVILLENDALEQDFLRRGHAVMHMDDGHTDDSYFKGLLANVQAVTWILQAGYNVWLTKADMLWAADPSPFVKETDADVLGFAAGRGMISTDFMHIKCSKTTMSLWRSIHKDCLQQVESMKKFKNDTSKRDLLEAAVGQMLMKSTVKFKFLLHDLRATINKSQPIGFLLRAPLLAGVQQIDDWSISVLKSLGLWTLDDDLVCTGVYC